MINFGSPRPHATQQIGTDHFMPHNRSEPIFSRRTFLASRLGIPENRPQTGPLHTCYLKISASLCFTCSSTAFVSVRS